VSRKKLPQKEIDMSNVAVKVKARPVPRTIVRAQIAGELIHACGGSDGEVEVAQKGVARQLLEKVIVHGVDGSGCVQDTAEVSFTGDASGDVSLDLDGGSRSAIEALDGGFGRGVAHVAERMRRRGLTADVRYAFTKEIYADAERLAAGRAELGIGPAAARAPGPGRKPTKVGAAGAPQIISRRS
jgi:hypothetical protein